MSRESDYNYPPPAFKPSPTSTTTHPSSDNNSTTSQQSETAIHNTSPTKQPPPPSKKTPSFPVREDCWSEEATFTLIEAWGDRFLQLSRGNLRQKHWQEVADAVNARHGHFKKARRTDVQCKNRIDTLKKKYKVEKSKALASNNKNNNYVSSWPFFPPLDSLIGSIFIKTLTKTPTRPVKRKRVPTTPSPSVPLLPPPPSSVPVGRRSKRLAPPLYQLSTDSSFFRRNFSVMAAAAAAIDGGGGGDGVDSDTWWSSGGNVNENWSGRRRRSEDRKPRRMVRVEKEEEEMEGDPYEKLAEAVARFAGVYARVEEAKQRQMVELEKQRMRFTKDLELQRIKLLMESQVQLEKLKQLKTNSEADFHRINEDHSTSVI